jgi:small subunit ribosomal protein S19
MSRSNWKGPFLDRFLICHQKKKNSVKIWSRRSVIASQMLGQTVLVHNGKEFKRIVVTREKLGFKYGEFAFTRKIKTKKLTQKK